MRLAVLSALAALFIGAFGTGAEAAGDLSAKANQAFLAANAARSGVVVRPSGLQYRVLRSGSGRTPRATDTVQVFYSGSFIDGRVFDATEPGFPAEFPVNGVIAGWTEALQLMKEGDKWELVIPSNLAYGQTGKGPIGPNQTLVFQVELLKVK